MTATGEVTSVQKTARRDAEAEKGWLVSQMVDLDPRDYVSVLSLLKKVDFLKELPEDELKNVLLSLQSEKMAAGRTILFQGEIANRLFVIRSGSVKIHSKIKGQKVELAELSEGSYFGEISLLRPMSATATAVSGPDGADLVVLTHDAMTELSRQLPDITKRIQEIIEARLSTKKKLKEQDSEGENHS